MLSNESREPLQNKVAASLGITNKAWRVVGADSSGNVLIADSLSWELRFDYDGRTDGQPVFVGYAPAGTATSTAAWLVHKFTFESINSQDFVSRRQVATDIAYDDRSTAF